MFNDFPPGLITITNVEPGSWAEQVGLSVGDWVTELNGRSLEQMSRDDYSQIASIRPLRIRYTQDATLPKMPDSPIQSWFSQSSPSTIRTRDASAETSLSSSEEVWNDFLMKTLHCREDRPVVSSMHYDSAEWSPPQNDRKELDSSTPST